MSVFEGEVKCTQININIFIGKLNCKNLLEADTYDSLTISKFDKEGKKNLMKYDPQKFIEILSDRINYDEIPECPYCGSQQYTVIDKFATILLDDNPMTVTMGSAVPSGMIICNNCGHIEFFALRTIGLF